MMNLDCMSFDTQGWNSVEHTDARRFWVNPDGVLIEFRFRTPTDFRNDLRSPEKLHEEMKDQADKLNSALIQFDVMEIQGLGVMRVITKSWSSEEADCLGKDYNGGLIFPLADGCFFVRVAAREQGMTGVREATVALLLHKQGKWALPDGSKPATVEPNPRTSLTREPLMLSPADDARFDAYFPDHPLTRVRSMLQHIENTLQIIPELRNAAPYRVG